MDRPPQLSLVADGPHPEAAAPTRDPATRPIARPSPEPGRDSPTNRGLFHRPPLPNAQDSSPNQAGPVPLSGAATVVLPGPPEPPATHPNAPCPTGRLR